jgi:hypothetical protein
VDMVMKLKRIKNITEPVNCSFCKEEKTFFRMQGYPHYGRTSCKKCFGIEKSKKEKYDEIWNDREQSIGESMIPYI